MIKLNPIHSDSIKIKKCTKCGLEKTLNEFHKRKDQKDGLVHQCKSCKSKSDNKYREVNKDKLNKKKKEYREANREKLRIDGRKRYVKKKEEIYEKQKEYRENNKEKVVASKKRWRDENIDEIREKGRNYYKENDEKIKEYQKKHYKENKEYISDRSKVYRENNKNEIKLKRQRYRSTHKEQRNAYERNKYATDNQYRLKSVLRNSPRDALKGGYKAGSTVSNLGCSVGFLEMYLESQFYPHSETGEEMTWDNHGNKEDGSLGWQIDHIMPLSYFDLTDECEFLQAYHYTNLQPLWYEHNERKIGKSMFDQLEDAMRDVLKRKVA